MNINPMRACTGGTKALLKCFVIEVANRCRKYQPQFRNMNDLKFSSSSLKWSLGGSWKEIKLLTWFVIMV